MTDTLEGKTEKTYLRGPLTIKDLDEVLEHAMEWVNEPEVTKNFAQFDHVYTKEEERAYLTKLLTSPTDRVYAIENEKHEYIGQIGIHQIYWPAKHGRIGTVLGKKSEWGKGHAKRALELLCPIAFKELGLNKLWAIFYKTNERMKHITDSLGFKQEGLLRQEYCHKGQYHDMIRMALLKDEYKAEVAA